MSKQTIFHIRIKILFLKWKLTTIFSWTLFGNFLIYMSKGTRISGIKILKRIFGYISSTFNTDDSNTKKVSQPLPLHWTFLKLLIMRLGLGSLQFLMDWNWPLLLRNFYFNLRDICYFGLHKSTLGFLNWRRNWIEICLFRKRSNRFVAGSIWWTSQSSNSVSLMCET